MTKIYFAASIRGGRDDVSLYLALIKHVQQHGDVLTEHVGNKALALQGEDGLEDRAIHDRDLAWLLEADVVIAEVSTPSLGVGYELGRAVEHKKPILCLYRQQEGRQLSAMIAGCLALTCAAYSSLEDAKRNIDSFLQT